MITVPDGCKPKHSYRYSGRANTPHPRCDDPQLLICEGCGDVLVRRCGLTRRSRCEPCSESWRRRLVQIVRSGLSGDRPGSSFFITLTAPGVAEGMVWSEVCGHQEGECSGDLGCVVEPVVAAHWNGTAPRRWSDFITYMRRALGCDVQFFGSWEPQKRGVLHRHFVVRTDRAVSERRMRAAVRFCGRWWSFGAQMKCDAITAETADRAARYLAKYCTKTADGMDDVRLLNVRTGELRHGGGFRSWSCSRRWGDSMAKVRSDQLRWVQSAGGSGLRRQPDAGAAGLDPKSESSTALAVLVVSEPAAELVPAVS